MGVTHETSFTMRRSIGLTLRATVAIFQHHQILRLPWNRPKSDRNLLKTAATSFTMRGRSENDPSMNPSVHNPPRNRGYFSGSARAFCMEVQHFALRLSFQISPSTAPATKSGSWTLPNAPPATKSDTWTSPHSARATKSDSTITWLYYDLTLLLLDYSLTLLLLDLLFDSTATLLCDVVRISEVSQPKLPLLMISTHKIISIINNPEVWRYLLLF